MTEGKNLMGIAPKGRDLDNEAIPRSKVHPPLISIVIPAYNAEATLERCLDSVIGQTYDHLEIVVIDDGSRDRTKEILDGYAAADSRVKSLHIPNGGVSAARNRGIAIATGEFVFFIDADDTIQPETIDLLYEGHRKSGAPLVICGFERFDPQPLHSNDSVVFKTDRLLSMADITLYVFKYLSAPNRHPLFVTSWGKLIRMDFVKRHALNFAEDMRTMEDVFFNFCLLSVIDSAYYVARPLYNYRVYTTVSSATLQAVGHEEGILGFAPALEGARRFLAVRCDDDAWVNRWVSHAYVTYTIVHLVRLCMQWKPGNFSTIRRFCTILLAAPRLMACLDHYAPFGSDSRVVPFLMRRKWIFPTMIVCKYKAWRRYSRMSR